MPSGPTISSRNWYTYDHAARLSCEYSLSARTIYRYDVRGNLLEVRNYNPSSMSTYSVQNDRLIALTYSSPSVQRRSEFSYDDLGRMTYDGQTGQSITYNTLDLVEKISVSSTTLVNYRYLAYGTKLSALDGSGEGFVYRGPFVYRTCDNGSSLTLESAVFGGGRLTPGGAMLYVTNDPAINAEAIVDTLKLRDELSSFEHAAEFGIDSYKNLRKSMVSTYGTGSGLEVHPDLLKTIEACFK